MGTKIENAVGVKDFSKRAKSFGLNTLHINDLDVENAYYKSKEIIDAARKFKPGFIEIECYRFYGHARMDKSPYRDEKEEKEKRQLDPISYASNKMIKNNISEAMATKSEDELGRKWDRCLADTAIKMTGGIFLGGIASLILFKRRTWPVVFGVGTGKAVFITK